MEVPLLLEAEPPLVLHMAKNINAFGYAVQLNKYAQNVAPPK
jgi:hypothetical protein